MESLEFDVRRGEEPWDRTGFPGPPGGRTGPQPRARQNYPGLRLRRYPCRAGRPAARARWWAYPLGQLADIISRPRRHPAERTRTATPTAAAASPALTEASPSAAITATSTGTALTTVVAAPTRATPERSPAWVRRAGVLPTRGRPAGRWRVRHGISQCHRVTPPAKAQWRHGAPTETRSPWRPGCSRMPSGKPSRSGSRRQRRPPRCASRPKWKPPGSARRCSRCKPSSTSSPPASRTPSPTKRCHGYRRLTVRRLTRPPGGRPPDRTHDRILGLWRGPVRGPWRGRPEGP